MYAFKINKKDKKKVYEYFKKTLFLSMKSREKTATSVFITENEDYIYLH